MSYIGATQGTSSPVLLDSITVVNNQAAYTMQKDGVNYTPASTLVMQVSLNGLIQQPNSSYTINGSTITFASALVTGDVINYILVREPTTGTVAPVDGSITTSKLVDGAVTNAKITSMASSKLTGALPALDGSALTGVSGGKVLQVVNQVYNSSQSFSITANTYQDTALTLNITPSASDSKILVFGNFLGSNTAGNLPIYFRIARELSSTTTGITQRLGHVGYVSNLENTIWSCNGTVLDDPQTTSQLTYKCQISRVNNGTAYFNTNYQSGNNGTQSSFLTAIEIGA